MGLSGDPTEPRGVRSNGVARNLRVERKGRCECDACAAERIAARAARKCRAARAESARAESAAWDLDTTG